MGVEVSVPVQSHSRVRPTLPLWLSLCLSLFSADTIDYADGQVEPSVDRELIEVVEVESDAETDEADGAEAASGEVAGVDAMFELVIGRLIRGPVFAHLPASQQLEASTKYAPWHISHVSN